MSIFDWILFGVSVIVFGVGAIFMVHQVFCGLEKTALNDKYVWGVNIQGFYFLSSAGIGILAVMAIGVIAFNETLYQEVFRIPAAIAFGCLLSSQILMAADLGRPFRALRIIMGKNFLSPLTLDFVVLLLLTISSFVFMFGILTHIEAILIIWGWGTLFVCIFGMIVHTLLFIPRVGSGYQSEPFQSALSMSCALWAGSAVLNLAFMGQSGSGFFETAIIIASIFALVSAMGSVLSDLLAGIKPHNLIFCIMAFVVTILLFVNGFILIESKAVQIIACILAIAAVYVEKHQTVLHLQSRPVLPQPYSQFEPKIFYRPVLSEWLNLISGLAAVIAITYAVMIIRVYALPWIMGMMS